MRLLQDWSTDQPGWWPSLSAAPAPLLDGVWGVRAGTCLGPRGPSLSSVPKNFEVEADDLVTISELGRGAYGVVEKVRHAQSGTIMAVKRIRATVNSQEQKRLLMDLDVNMRTVDCFYTVTFYGALFREGDVWICMELMDTSLDKFYRKVLEKNMTIPEDILGEIAVSIVRALEHLHSKLSVIHRDVKPSNVLINKEGHVKMCDFGISGYLVDSVAKTMDAGCKPYMAPERINPELNQKGYNVKSDVWSLGITMPEKEPRRTHELPGADAGQSSTVYRERSTVSKGRRRFHSAELLTQSLQGNRPFAGPSPGFQLYSSAGAPRLPSTGPTRTFEVVELHQQVVGFLFRGPSAFTEGVAAPRWETCGGERAPSSLFLGWEVESWAQGGHRAPPSSRGQGPAGGAIPDLGLMSLWPDRSGGGRVGVVHGLSEPPGPALKIQRPGSSRCGSAVNEPN
uniref:mitogen-activated protein kinase kinase n=1 Tax=Sus scrofa TaxID=9823 RepID=A0A8D1C7B6_PIG